MNPNDLPPQAIEAEQSVLGGLLLENGSYERIDGTLTAHDFYSTAHQAIYRAIVSLLSRGEPADAITVSDALEKTGESENVGGLAYLGDLAANTPTAANIKAYAKMVLDAKGRRNLIQAGQRIIELGQDKSTDTITLADQAASIVAKLSDQRGGNDPAMISDLLVKAVDNIRERIDSGGSISGLSTGFVDLDRAMTGLHPGNLVVLAGRPAMGKTTLGVNIAENVAINGGTALVFSLEMPSDDLAERSIARAGGINTQALREGRLTAEDYERLSAALAKLNGTRLIIDEDAATGTVAQIRRKALRVKREGGLSLVVIDYLQLMRGDGGNRNEEIGGITRGLKLLAKELHVPIVLLSQLNRGVEDRTDKRPMMSDLRESGAIEQDADVILMAYRDDYYNPNSTFKGYAEILIRKQRMGPIGTVPLIFQGEYSRFCDADRSEYARIKTENDYKPMPRRGLQIP